MIALTALERNPAAAAEPAVIETVRALLDAADPYLAAQALHTVHTLLGDDARELVQRAAREGPAPVRHVARTLLKTTPSRGSRTPRGGTIPVTRINPGMISPRRDHEGW